MSFFDEFKEIEIPNFGLVQLPKVQIDSKYKQDVGLPESCSNYDFLSTLTKKELKKKLHKLPKEKHQDYIKRAKYELSIYEELGFTDYILLIWQIVNEVRKMGGFIDYGRGSCSGAFTFGILGITGILDVIDKGLIFERFINRARSKKEIINGETYLHGELLCDVDLNLGDSRDAIVEWLKILYPNKLAKILAISTLTGKILIKDVYKTIEEVTEEEAKHIADLVEKHFGIVEDISKMPEKSIEFKEWSEKHFETFKIALKLRNLIRQYSSHASGYFISSCDLDGYAPLVLNKDKELTLAYDMEMAAKLGIKVDCLGLATNSLLNEFFKLIPEKIEDIELETNPVIYNQFQTGKLLPYGLYQVSADCAYRVANKIKPKNIFELSDTSAISRPGALDYLDIYVNKTAKSPHQIFDSIIANTRNVFLYQEQLLEALMVIGFDASESESCRKIVGKKLIKEVKEWEQKIYDKVKENNLPEEIGKIIWKILNDSAKYSFNKSHSVSTSLLTALTVWCKYKYPLQFYKCCLSATRNLPTPMEDIAAIYKELQHFNIELLPPSITKSQLDFSIEGNNIRFGLLPIKGIAEKSIEKLNQFRKPYANKFEIFKGAEEAGLQVGILAALIQAGAMENLNQSRSWVVLEACLWRILTEREKMIVFPLGEQFNYDLLKIVRHLNETAKTDTGKPVIKDSRMATIKRHYDPYKKIYLLNSKSESYANWWYERALCGYSYSGKLSEIFSQDNFDFISLSEVNALEPEEYCEFIGVIKEVKESVSKAKKTPYVKFVLEDELASCTVLVFHDNKIAQCKLETGELPKENQIISVRGVKKGDAVFANHITLQKESNIYMKLSELKEKEKNLTETPAQDTITV